ncbi:DUF4249 domain-containing protein [Aquimarina sp. 2-A2]|uniref:DUF4249 domain-containing protein n=1 Tax=Aquimarina sp. 2-A2 TaxID=3382644 RepID=UPI00387F1029
MTLADKIFMDKRKKIVPFIVVVTLLFYGCVEPFDIETENFESILVVDAKISNELKQHSIKLSRTFQLNQKSRSIESNAEVEIKDSQGNSYYFEENDEGEYLSESIFRVLPDIEYTLKITLANGKKYSSESVMPPPEGITSQMKVNRFVNDLGEDGIGIFVDGASKDENVKFIKYEYTETYKIVAPYWTPLDIIIVSRWPPVFDFIPKTTEQRICYRTEYSNDIIQAKTTDVIDGKLSDFLVRFIAKDDSRILNRYSIEVNQFIQTQEAYSFFETLNTFSSSENLFSQVQTGFIDGNIRSESDAEEKVLGYFEVATVSKKRIFINFNDYFDGEPLPSFQTPCDFNSPLPEFKGQSPLVDALDTGLYKWAGEYEGPYTLVPKPCGDCTELGSNIVPEFWKD